MIHCREWNLQLLLSEDKKTLNFYFRGTYRMQEKSEGIYIFEQLSFHDFQNAFGRMNSSGKSELTKKDFVLWMRKNISSKIHVSFRKGAQKVEVGFIEQGVLDYGINMAVRRRLASEKTL